MQNLDNKFRSKIISLVAPVIRIFPPWWKLRFYMHLAGNSYQQGGYFGEVKKKKLFPHNYQIELALDDWMERLAYYLGCFYEIDATATVLDLLRRGDCFIDVGANLGFLTLTASRVVGSEGKVLAFEPNKTVADRLSHTLLVNRINNVFVHKHALGDEEGKATLNSSAHSGTGSLRHIGASGTRVDVLCGDRFISDLPEDTWVLVKLDVEGYELRVLKGFKSLLKRARTGFLIEVTDEWLRTTGGSADELFELMLVNGFEAYLPKLTFFSKFKLRLINRPVADRHQYDVVFLRKEDSWHARTS